MGYIKIILSAVILLLGETAAAVVANGGAAAGGPAGGSGNEIQLGSPENEFVFNFGTKTAIIADRGKQVMIEVKKQNLKEYYQSIGYQAKEIVDGEYLVSLNPKGENRLWVPVQSRPIRDNVEKVVKYNTTYLALDNGENFSFKQVIMDYATYKSEILRDYFACTPTTWENLGIDIELRNYCLSYKNMFLEFGLKGKRGYEVMQIGNSTIRFVDQANGTVISLAEAINNYGITGDDIQKFLWLLGYIYGATCAYWAGSWDYLGRNRISVDRIVLSDDMKTLGITKDKLVQEIKNGYYAGYGATDNRGTDKLVVAVRK